MNLDRAIARAWAEVDEDALLHNYHLARSLCNEKTEFICVVKANAYGLGLFRTVETLHANGANWFAVAAPEEALTARRAGRTVAFLEFRFVLWEFIQKFFIDDICSFTEILVISILQLL